MSTFIHGGSALKLDVGAKAHAALSRGDVVEINPLVGSADDGYETRDLPNANTRQKQVSILGVVLGSAGKSTFAIGEDVLIRLVGVCDAAFSASTTAGLLAVPNWDAPANNFVSTAAGTYSAPSNHNRILGVIHETRSGAGLAKVFINSLSSW